MHRMVPAHACMMESLNRKSIVLVPLAGVLTLAGCDQKGSVDSQADSSALSEGRSEIALDLTLELPGEDERAASIDCLGAQVSGDGYLGEKLGHASAACITLIIDEDARRWLVDGDEFTGSECTSEVPADLLDARLTIEGTFRGEVKRALVLEDSCDYAMWQQLGPLIEPTQVPNVTNDQ